MEKKVTGIDLDELKRAREEMMAEMGITPSPADYSEANQQTIQPNEPSEFVDVETQVSNHQQAPAEEQAELDSDAELFDMINNFISNVEDTEDGLVRAPKSNESAPSLEPAPVQSSASSNVASVSNVAKQRNLSHYDVFAPFEINAPKSSTSQEFSEPKTQAQDNNEISSDGMIIEDVSDGMLDSFEPELESQSEPAESEETQDLSEPEFDGVDENDILNIIGELEAEKKALDANGESEEILEAEELEQKGETQEPAAEISLEKPVMSEPDQEKEISSQDVFIDISDGEDIDSDEDVDDFDFFNLSENKEAARKEQVSQEIKDVISQEASENVSQEANNNISDEIEDDEILNELKKQKIMAENASFVHISPEYENPHKKPDFLPEIDPVSFVNVLSMQEFKSSDNFTFVLGRSETGNILFETLKNCYNIAFFANENSYELLNTMLLSFMLKNSASEFKLALCDGADTNTFNYYLGSKYLFGGSIAKNEDDIMQKLTEILIELEARYHTLAKFNVRSVEEYNILAKNTNTPKLSQILIVIDGYYELMHSSSFEKIKNCLYQILRLGRIAGIYAVVVTNQKIDEDIINFNLPSRIGFKCSENDDSISMIGESGIDKLANKNEFLYSSINQEYAQHIRQPMVSDAIIKILIDNIEK